MNAERWKRIEEVYHSALASPRAGRAALLDELCSGDCDMRREVESLLEAVLAEFYLTNAARKAAESRRSPSSVAGVYSN